MTSYQVSSPRQQTGQRIGIIGILVNAVLFTAKFAVGTIGHSTSILADALNSLTDCISSATTLVGFSICGKQADEKHPNGYGRMEYICGFLVSLFIMTTALSFGRTALIRIVKPQAVAVPAQVLWILLAAISIKILFAAYTYAANRQIHSATLKTLFKDSLSDALLTGLSTLPVLLPQLTGFSLDGIIGLLISAGILWSGVTSFIEHLDLLLGPGSNAQLNEQIKQLILTQKDIFHEVISIATFDYGPEKQIAFIQVHLNEVPEPNTVQSAISDTIQTLKNTLNIDATIYWQSDDTLRRQITEV